MKTQRTCIVRRLQKFCDLLELRYANIAIECFLREYESVITSIFVLTEELARTGYHYRIRIQE